VTLAAGVFSETQNYERQALIFLWTVCLRVLVKIRRRSKSSPVPWALSVAADPLRTVQSPSSEERQAISDTDLVLYPTFPTTASHARLFAMYA
jgi:hypothetical protein